jgi:hypothetical protein
LSHIFPPFLPSSLRASILHFLPFASLSSLSLPHGADEC